MQAEETKPNYREILKDCVERYKNGGPEQDRFEADELYEARVERWRGYLRRFIALVCTQIELEEQAKEKSNGTLLV